MVKVATGFWVLHRPVGPYTGIWPIGLIKRLKRKIGWSDKVLEVCSGTSKEGITIDLNLNMKPDICADAHHLPFRDGVFDRVLFDPPYNDDYVQHYSDIAKPQVRSYPSFKLYKALEECTRVCSFGGCVILLHWLIAKKPLYTVRSLTVGITTGPNKRIRCLQVFKKVQHQLSLK